MEVLKEPDGELRCVYTLELLGYWFVVDGVNYYFTLENK